jgi:hypothetical protein
MPATIQPIKRLRKGAKKPKYRLESGHQDGLIITTEKPAGDGNG